MKSFCTELLVAFYMLPFMNSKKPLLPNAQYNRYTGLLSQPAPATNPLPALIGVSFWRLAPVPSNPRSLVIFHFVSSLLTRQLHTDLVSFIFRFLLLNFLRFVSCFLTKAAIYHENPVRS